MTRRGTGLSASSARRYADRQRQHRCPRPAHPWCGRGRPDGRVAASSGIGAVRGSDARGVHRGGYGGRVSAATTPRTTLLPRWYSCSGTVTSAYAVGSCIRNTAADDLVTGGVALIPAAHRSSWCGSHLACVLPVTAARKAQGYAQLEVAVPSSLTTPVGSRDGKRMARIIIGVDPHSVPPRPRSSTNENRLSGRAVSARPGRTRGATLTSSAAHPIPMIDTSDKSLPGPATSDLPVRGSDDGPV